ncbi:hypothetical protein ACJVDH_10605 [Pedobacter sp. AW1-32]|uniref:hypothetical protein n=1 Tax=Pedobacter sp. AW1-32 TaxID=3383026 RepID=UPI003FEE7ED1
MRKKQLLFLSCATAFFACTAPTPDKEKISTHLQGTWKLISATTTERGKTTVTDFTKNQEMIKIINESHFSFLRHNLSKVKDSVNGFDAGGGRYVLNGNAYKEYLDFYTDKNWEGKSFDFRIRFAGDTLIQTGTEKVPERGIDRVITECYLKL